MIDQTAVATGVPVAPKNTSKKDQADAFAQNDESGKSFKDLVDDGSAKNFGSQDLVDALADQVAENAQPGQKADAKPVQLSNRMKIAANLEALARYGRNSGASEEPVNRSVGAVTGKQKSGKLDDKISLDKVHANAADELHALLGLGDQEEANGEIVAVEEDSPAASPKKSLKPKAENDVTAVANGTAGTGLTDATSNSVPEKQLITTHEATSSRDRQPAITVDAGDDASSQSPLGTATPLDEKRTAETEAKSASVNLTATQKKSLADTEQPVGKTDFVTVLESRSYLGFGTDSNAGALTHAVKTDSALSNALSIAHLSADKSATSTEVNTLKLELNPENLGTMVASLRLKGDELSVEVKVETIEAYRQLTSDRDGIVRALQDHGFNIDQVSVQLSPSAKSETNQDGNQPSSGQNLREGQGEGNRQREDNTRRMSNSNTWSENDQSNNQNSAGTHSGAARPGNLYL